MRDVVDLDKCAIITACPGAGKTTLATALSRRIKPTEHILVITYNKNLELDLMSKVRKLGLLNLEASTVHGLVGRQSREQCTDDAEMLKIVENELLSMDILHKDILYVDEAQDLRPLFVQALVKVFARCAKPPRMIVCGDEKQMIYDFNSLRDDKATADFLRNAPQYFGAIVGDREWTRHKFTKSFRLTPNIATFVNTWWGTSIVGCNTRASNCKVNYLYYNPYRRELAAMIEQSIDKYGCENVLIVGQSTKAKTPLTRQSNYLTTPVHLKDGGGGGTGVDPNELARKTHVLTACKSKGCEYKVVWFIGFCVYNLDLMMAVNQVCVGLSRASVELNVVQTENKHIYPIGGDVGRMDETYEKFQALVTNGVVSVIAPLPKIDGPMISKPRETIAVTECTRVNARDLRAIQNELGAATAVQKVDIDERKMAYNVGRSFMGLYYDVSDLYGDAVPFALQAQRGVAPPQIMQYIMNAVIIGGKHGFTHTSALRALERDGVTVSSHFTPFEQTIFIEELKARLVGCMTRGTYAIDMGEHCDSEFFKHLNAARQVCMEDLGLKGKRPSAVWLYLAAAIKARDGYRNRWYHMGTSVKNYEWYDSELFEEATRVLDAELPLGGLFEQPLSWRAPLDLGIILSGRADWVDFNTATVYELKFTSSLCEEHRFQTKIYGAMLACMLQKPTTAILFNARTGTRETYKIEPGKAEASLTYLLQLHART